VAPAEQPGMSRVTVRSRSGAETGAETGAGAEDSLDGKPEQFLRVVVSRRPLSF